MSTWLVGGAQARRGGQPDTRVSARPRASRRASLLITASSGDEVSQPAPDATTWLRKEVLQLMQQVVILLERSRCS